MIGLGTIVNAAAVVVGAVLGMLFHGGLKERFQSIVMKAIGLSVIFIGISGALENMLVVTDSGVAATGTMEIIIAMVIGGLLGEWIDIEKRMEQFGEFLKKKIRSKNDPFFVEGFVSASLIICIGAMAVVGAIQDGIFGDWSLLATKAVLDFIIIMVMTCSLGKGCAFSAIPVLIFEGVITVFASFLKPVMTELAMDYLSLIGSILIFCVGLNLVWGKKIRVANMLPAVVLAVAAAFMI